MRLTDEYNLLLSLFFIVFQMSSTTIIFGTSQAIPPVSCQAKHPKDSFTHSQVTAEAMRGFKSNTIEPTSAFNFRRHKSGCFSGAETQPDGGALWSEPTKRWNKINTFKFLDSNLTSNHFRSKIDWERHQIRLGTLLVLSEASHLETGCRHRNVIDCRIPQHQDPNNAWRSRERFVQVCSKHRLHRLRQTGVHTWHEGARL